MEVSSETKDGIAVVSASGAIDHSTAEEFEASAMPALDSAEASGTALVFDLSQVDYMSSVGLRVLMLVAKAAKIKSVSIAICGLQPSLAEIFQISRFDKIFDIYDDLKSASDALQG